MNQINLKAETIKSSNRKFTQSVGGTTSILIGAVILLSSIGVYAGVYFYHGKVKAEVDEKTSNLTARQIRLSSTDFNDLFFFQDRLTELKGRINNRADYDKTINLIAKNTMQEVYYDKVGLNVVANGAMDVEISIQTPNIDILNKQLKALSLIDGVKDFSPTGIGRPSTENGNVGTSVRFRLVTVPPTPPAAPAATPAQ